MHKSGDNIMLYDVAIKGFPFLSHIFIWTSSVCFALSLYSSETLIYLSVSTNEPGIKSEISGVIWQVLSESKIQLVSCDIYS